MKTYTYNEVYKSTLEYFNNDELATGVWITKYALKDNNGNYYELNPDEMLKNRITPELARIENKYPNPISEEEIYESLKDFKYVIPQGSPLFGIGNNFQIASLANCFVIHNPDDSYSSICKTDEEQVQLMKRRGGVGHDLSHLRPATAIVNNSAMSSTGAVSFMERYSNSTKEVAQGGRRGALMLSMHVNHPDIDRFITAKSDDSKITGANVSVKVTDEFLYAVKNNADFYHTFPISLSKNDTEFSNTDLDKLEYNKLVAGKSGNTYIKKTKAIEIWNLITSNVWKNAEPGVLFWDTIIKESPADCYEEFKTISTNPCVVGDTLILTNIGLIKIKHLYKYKDVKIITRDKNGNLYNSELKNVMITEKNSEIYRVNLANGEFLLVNSKHKFYDTNFNEINVHELIDKDIISYNGIMHVIGVEKTNHNEDVYDLTTIPNYNFFSVLNYPEYIIKEDIIINENIHLKYFEIVFTDKGQIFAHELTEEHELI